MRYFCLFNSPITLVGLFLFLLNLNSFAGKILDFSNIDKMEKAYIAAGLSFNKGLSDEAKKMFGDDFHKTLLLKAGFGTYSLCWDLGYEIKISDAIHWDDASNSPTSGAYYSHEVMGGLSTYLFNNHKVKNSIKLCLNALYETLATNTSLELDNSRTIVGFSVGSGVELHLAQQMFAEFILLLKHFNSRDVLSLSIVLSLGD